MVVTDASLATCGKPALFLAARVSRVARPVQQQTRHSTAAVVGRAEDGPLVLPLVRFATCS